MIIRWSYKAQKQLNQVADYIYNEFGEKSLLDFYNKLDSIETELLSFPELGKEEPLLVGKSHIYRSIVITKKSKLVYTTDADCIRISALWDTRREPKKQANTLK
ncbi:MAG: type II toxin-antitoxin system RelE/ParE family toxin [Paludibacteraceae bacterium]|nr:type II toxin-antitoxin system RelE/ParE family toxin [Paludibacteraceae bacterium]MBQ4508544.1 type II toxin-antitoxin system RelE/ParE family toxin [Paludibacteraceae bacterium]MBQ6764821.1 type II toxin-antitoxin system RelE/ParE family toxin [Paludibacteraceae bacterium]